MTTLRSFFRPAGILGVLLVAAVVLLAGCEENGTNDDATDNGTPFTIESDIDDETIAAIVSSDYGTDTLTVQEFEEQMQMAMQGMPPDQQDPEQLAAMHNNLLEQQVARHVLIGEADARGLEADDDEIDGMLEQQKAQYPSEEDYEEALAQSGMTEDELREGFADQSRVQTLLEELTADAPEPSDEDVEEYAREQSQAGARHILIEVAQDADDETVEDARQRAQDLIDRLNDGEDFEELAREYSEGPSADQGGDLGMFGRDQMVGPFADVVFDELSEEGEIAQEPVRTDFGFHVIQLTNPSQPLPDDEAREALAQTDRQAAYEGAVDELMEQATVRINPNVVELGNDEEGA